MPENNTASSRGLPNLRLTSSGSKIFNQIMMFAVVGVLPLLFPQWIQIENRQIVFIIVSVALVASILFEVIRFGFDKAQKDTKHLLNLQLLTDVSLLALFLHFFGHINGPFFVLYLLTAMESFLNLNLFFSATIISIMILTTSVEFFWLATTGEIAFGFVPLVGYVIRIISIIFISAYGFVLAKTTSELHQANYHLKELDRLKDEFVATASHELRTPMTAIKSYVWMVENDKAGPISDTAKKYLDIVSSSTERLLHLIGNMLDISRIESGKYQLKLDTFNISILVDMIRNEFAAKAAELHLNWEVSVEENLPLITADKDKITQVMENLIGNAMKYTPAEGKVSLLVKRDNSFLTVSVIDTGSGILPEDIPHLFTKFSRLGDKFATYSQTGSGLGLYLSKQYIEMHHGAITVNSSLGSGSTFTFTLPIDNIKP